MAQKLKQPKSEPKKRDWCVVRNNYTDEDIQMIERLKGRQGIKYIIYAFETGKEGTPHIQGAVIWDSPRTKKCMEKLLPGWFVEYRKRTVEELVMYPMKDGEFIEWGERPKAPEQGARNDLVLARELAKKKLPLHVIGEVCGYQATKHAETMIKSLIQTQKRKCVPQVIWVYGPTGAGKTKYAMERLTKEIGLEPDLAEDLIYKSPPNITTFWTGYQGEEYVILDDIRGCDVPMNHLTQWLDRYKCIINIKYGHANIMAKMLIITTVKHPYEFYSDFKGEDPEQIARRCTEIIHMTKDGTKNGTAQRSTCNVIGGPKSEWIIP